ncbi:hypothetical protein C0Q70_16052 [Pomacea canaliculata]|uniref:Uncharacterized protein n=1 Tax=Pomacea canaliculata TaxID=400727 RepID=A0A2T7NNS3_POMCA|nr:hypothetical protein C0Q70_16052 [Pomacea canaliculata]
MGNPLQLVDIEELLRDSAERILDNELRKKADLEHPDINWDRMHVTHSETQYTDSHRSPKPTAHVLFTANFSNDTPNPQRYTLRTERRTKSTCNIALCKTYTIGAHVEIKLTPPNPIIEANAGFHGEMSMSKGINETFEQELAWTVDNEIQVPPGHVTKADLVIKEDEFDGEFTIETTFEGTVAVTYETKKQPPVKPITEDEKVTEK